jgi:hypothetical protein
VHEIKVNRLRVPSMAAKLDLKGKVFTRLTVLDKTLDKTHNKSLRWVCRCECGTITFCTSYNLTSGHTKSCGCYRRDLGVSSNTTHGLHKHPLYEVYLNMKARCLNTKGIHYKNYGGRGITICDRWLNSFENFYEDVESGYSKGFQIDRTDNDGNYEPSNYRWTTRNRNQMNKGSLIGSTSQYKGVSWNKKGRKWFAKIKKNSKVYHLGYFIDEKEAALAYNKKAFELNGEYAYLNKVS